MPSNQNRSDFTMLSPHHLMVTAIAFAVPYVLGIFFSFGDQTIYISLALAAGIYILTPPVEKKSVTQARAQAIEEAKPKSYDISLEDWPIPRAVEHMEGVMLPRVWDARVSKKARKFLSDATWVHDHYDALVDFPEHQATVNGAVRLWVPQTLRLFIDANKASPGARARAIDSATKSLDTLHEEVLRIKAAILRGKLMELESHAEALQRTFGGKPGIRG